MIYTVHYKICFFLDQGYGQVRSFFRKPNHQVVTGVTLKCLVGIVTSMPSFQTNSTKAMLHSILLFNHLQYLMGMTQNRSA